MIRKRCVFFALLFIAALSIKAQGYPPNTTHYGANGYIEYFSGTLPVILSSPHGGDLQPASIPNRNCSGCVTVNDAYTQDLTRELDSLLFLRYGCHPHFAINRLARIKLDANREIIEAAQGNPDAEQAWTDFHAFIQAAKDSIARHYGAGLFVDVHGHGHSVQRLELGYLLNRTELQQPDSLLDVNLSDSVSIRNLVLSNPSGYTLSGLLRGADAFGTYCEDRNVAAVPSAQDPFPTGTQSYFAGGYNTRRHGSRQGGTIDAIQIECNQDVRFTTQARLAFADSLAGVIMAFLERHYFSDSVLQGCAITLDRTGAKAPRRGLQPILHIYPNPGQQQFRVRGSWPSEHCMASLHAITGEKLHEIGLDVQAGEVDLELQLPVLPSGVYLLRLAGRGCFWNGKLLVGTGN